jgi:hypothetical protein
MPSHETHQRKRQHTHASTLAATLPVLLSLGCQGMWSGGEASPDTGTTVRAAMCPPPDLFDHAFCLCEDFLQAGVIDVKAGPAGPGAVGVNGRTVQASSVSAEGGWFSYAGYTAATESEILGGVTTAGDFSWAGSFAVGGDLAVGGNLTGAGLLSVAGALRVGGDERTAGDIQAASRAPYEAPAGPPCPCDPATFFDVAAAVATARTANDNAAVGLPGRITQAGVNEISLPSGSYFLEDVLVAGKTTFRIEGHVFLYI